MHTKRANLSADNLQRFNDALRRPHTWQITGIEAFWLENPAGVRFTGEFPDAGPAYEAVLAEIGRGVDPDSIVLVGRRPDGGRSVLGHGLDLLDVAEAHAGISSRPRVRAGSLAGSREHQALDRNGQKA